MNFLRLLWSPKWIVELRQLRVFLIHRSLLLITLLTIIAVSVNSLSDNFYKIAFLYPVLMLVLLFHLHFFRKTNQTSIISFLTFSTIVSIIPLLRDSGIYPSYFIWVIIATWLGAQTLPPRLKIISSLPLIPTILYPAFQTLGIYNPTQLIYDIGAPTQVVHNLFGFGIGFFLFLSSQFKEKEDQKKFTRSQNMNQSLLNAIPDLIFVQNINSGVFIDYHSSHQDTFIPASEFLGKSHSEIMPPFLVKKIDLALDKIKQTKKPTHFDYFLEKNGQMLYYETRVVAMGNDHAISVIRDVTELQVAKRKAESNAYSRSLFLSTMSHEIRTPLNGILSMSHLLLDESPTPVQKEMLGTLNFSSEHLLTIVNDILDFSKIDAGMMTLDPRPENLKSITKNLINIFKSKAEENGSEISFSYTGETQNFLSFDAPRLSQILANLISNAIKFTQNGQIKISIKVSQDTHSHQTIEFSVKDTGIGMSEETQTKIFTPFTQATTSTSRNFGGTGLGISISSQLLTLMESKLRLKSKLGKGSEFYFNLYLAKSKIIDIQSTIKLQAPNISLDHLNLLVVEDNFINQKVVKKVLCKWNIQPTVVSNGREALDIINSGETTFDIIFMDLHMPVMDGYNATHKIRQLGYNGDIWALSADVIEGTSEKLTSIGFNGIILKPFKPNELLKILSSIKKNSLKIPK
jgi:signal transduction histidine kinase